MKQQKIKVVCPDCKKEFEVDFSDKDKKSDNSVLIGCKIDELQKQRMCLSEEISSLKDELTICIKSRDVLEHEVASLKECKAENIVIESEFLKYDEKLNFINKKISYLWSRIDSSSCELVCLINEIEKLGKVLKC